jgi:hypothetical protein
LQKVKAKKTKLAFVDDEASEDNDTNSEADDESVASEWDSDQAVKKKAKALTQSKKMAAKQPYVLPF